LYVAFEGSLAEMFLGGWGVIYLSIVQ